MTDLTDANWRKPKRSSAQGNCVEVADNLPDVIGVRDSKDASGPALRFRPEQWSTFVEATRTHRLN
ncbi:DUF397 domain-containing protein [Micromonospora sp. STR1_7]|uniref:DUF397 domain-containing protein n=1 Tax=Micromonospora parastrephiae TaxID=2806101 RepID=A0ABS1XVT2_9ACTN|nr:DUF397 domain-containing protein [Micromonospora parastrephiae]MBM0233274.1 DUF397 domain-containing protein [Micromonospora parastrephiae]